MAPLFRFGRKYSQLKKDRFHNNSSFVFVESAHKHPEHHDVITNRVSSSTTVVEECGSQEASKLFVKIESFARLTLKMMSQEVQQTFCSMCNHKLREGDLDNTCIDCAIFYQGGLLETYKKNMGAAQESEAKKLSPLKSIRLYLKKLLRM